MTLVYTDSPNKAVGFIDIADPAAPAPLGAPRLRRRADRRLDPRRRPPSSASTPARASPSPRAGSPPSTSPTRAETASCDLGGQPDSIALAPDGSFVVVAIENERDEDVDDGGLPQMPAGYRRDRAADRRRDGLRRA